MEKEECSSAPYSSWLGQHRFAKLLTQAMVVFEAGTTEVTYSKQKGATTRWSGPRLQASLTRFQPCLQLKWLKNRLHVGMSVTSRGPKGLLSQFMSAATPLGVERK